MNEINPEEIQLSEDHFKVLQDSLLANPLDQRTPLQLQRDKVYLE